MSDSQLWDAIVVGSGPGGGQAAQVLLEKGLRVALFDIGFEDQKYAPKIPNHDFSTLRQTDLSQRYYLLGEDCLERVLSSQNSVAPHLTPPRTHMIERMQELFPIQSVGEDLSLLQSTGRGGLGVSWGANCFEFDAQELDKIGLPVQEIQEIYKALSKDIGVSGPAHSDIHRFVSPQSHLQSPLDLDGNSSKIYSEYKKKRLKLNSLGFYLGPSVLAVLTESKGHRQPNLYHDMDFWTDQGRSVYRPQFTLEKLIENSNLTYFPQHLCLKIKTQSDGTTRIKFFCLKDQTEREYHARKVILAAGAINSAKVVLNSKNDFETELPFLCNPNHWIAGINLKTLGKSVPDRRHSLSQLTAVKERTDDEKDYLVAHFYSYRSLLMYRLVKEVPFDPFVSLQLFRLLLTSLTVINLHFSDHGHDKTRFKLLDQGPHGTLQFKNEGNKKRRDEDRAEEEAFLKNLLSLWIVPMKVRRPPRGSSIHYAGTLPRTDAETPYGTKPSGELWGFPGVYVADSSSWRFLPAKGLTFTLMANARRVAQELLKSIVH